MSRSDKSGMRYQTTLRAVQLLLPLSLPFAVLQAQDVTQYGPARGALVIAGGGQLNGTGIMERFIELAGGDGAKIVVVPTAGGNLGRDGSPTVYDPDRVLAGWKARGLTNVHMLHTHDRSLADTDSFAAVLRDADAVWFNGGRQWNIVDSYAETLTYRLFHEVLERGGVIGGSSAGATIQGAYLVRGATAGPHIMMTDEPNHQDAFNFLRRSAIDQHVDARDRWNDLIAVMDRFPDYIGLGISEGTAVVVQGDTFEVIGKAEVAVHDRSGSREVPEPPFIKLSAGSRYDMRERTTLSADEPGSAANQSKSPMSSRSQKQSISGRL